MAKENKKCCGFCRFLGKLFLFITAVCAFTAAVMKIFDYFKSEKLDKINKESEFKELWNLVGSKKFSLTDSDISGIISKNIFGITKLDLTGASFKKDGFISLTSYCSIVEIIVPNDVNVTVDGLINASSVDNDAEVFDDSLPTLYIASKFNCSMVRISRQE